MSKIFNFAFLFSGKTPVIILIVVVFPAPFGPKRPTISPCFIENEILSTAIRSPNFFVKFKAETAFFFLRLI